MRTRTQLTFDSPRKEVINMAYVPTLKCFPYRKTVHRKRDGGMLIRMSRHDIIIQYDIKAWCPFCKKWHVHGHSIVIDKGVRSGIEIRGGRNLGHRTAHCGDNSPFRETGYYLKLMTKKELNEVSKALSFYEK